MSATATEMWSGRGWQESAGADGGTYVGDRKFLVAHAASEDEARTAVGININDAFSPGDPRKCRSIQLESCPGPTTWIIVYHYEMAGAWQGTGLDPTAMMPSLTWMRCQESHPEDRDISGNAIMNSAGDPFNPPYQRDYSLREFAIEKNFSSYNDSMANAFEGAVNSVAVKFWGAGAFPAGVLRCLTIAPTAPILPNYTYVRVRFHFRVNYRGHKIIRVDQGRRGWYDAGGGVKKHGSFCSEGATAGRIGEVYTDDTLLDGLGKPLDMAVKVVTDYTAGTCAGPVNRPGGLPTGATAVPVVAGGLTVQYNLVYDGLPTADFNALGLA